MPEIWGIHNDKFDATYLVERGFVSIGWDAIGDLREVGDDQERMKQEVARAYPGQKPGAVPVVAGVLRRFAFTAQTGDLVIAPNRKARTLNFGRITGPYSHHPAEPTHRHRRMIEWLVTEVPRANFSQSALYEVGSAVTMFRVSSHADEFLARIAGTGRMDVPASAWRSMRSRWRSLRTNPALRRWRPTPKTLSSRHC